MRSSNQLGGLSYGRSLADRFGSFPKREGRRWDPVYRCDVTYREFALDFYDAHPDASEKDCDDAWAALAPQK